jgi:hypothetical protein
MTKSMENQLKMCPNDVLEKTRQQVQDLFDEFLNISTKHCNTITNVNKSIEVNEVHMDPFPLIKTPPTTAPPPPVIPRLERDTGERIAKPPRPISRGSIPDIDMEFYRKTPNTEPPLINPIPPRPGAGPSMPRGILDQQPSTVIHRGMPFERPRRTRTYSQGPNDQQLQQAAFVIAEFGDELEKKYGPQMDAMGTQITEFLRSASGDIAYAEFSRHMNKLMSEGDTNATNLMLLMTVGKRVLSVGGSVLSNVKSYFGRYAGERYAASVAQKNDVVTFIKEEEEKRTKL